MRLLVVPRYRWLGWPGTAARARASPPSGPTGVHATCAARATPFAAASITRQAMAPRMKGREKGRRERKEFIQEPGEPMRRGGFPGRTAPIKEKSLAGE